MTTSANSVVTDSSRSQIVPAPVRSTPFSFVAQVVAIALMILAMLFGYGRCRTGSSELVWPWFMGRKILFTPTQIELGNVSPNQVIEKQIRVINVSSNPLSLLGSQASCGCIGLDDFPIEIAAHNSIDLRIKMGTSTKSGGFEHTIKFFSEQPDYSVDVVTIRGVVP